MNDDNPPVAQVQVSNAPRGGTHLQLHSFCLQERGGDCLETIPLAALASVRAGFERDGRKIERGVLLILVAVAVYAVAAPIEELAGGAAADVAMRLRGEVVAPGASVAGVLYATLDLLQTFARMLPGPAAAFAVWGVWRIVQGILGTTTLTLLFGGARRDYSARGRDTKLFDFAEQVGRNIGRLKP